MFNWLYCCFNGIGDTKKTYRMHQLSHSANYTSNAHVNLYERFVLQVSLVLAMLDSPIKCSRFIAVFSEEGGSAFAA